MIFATVEHALLVSQTEPTAVGTLRETYRAGEHFVGVKVDVLDPESNEPLFGYGVEMSLTTNQHREWEALTSIGGISGHPPGVVRMRAAAYLRAAEIAEAYEARIARIAPELADVVAMTHEIVLRSAQDYDLAVSGPDLDVTDGYYVCNSCAHTWASPQPPGECENCGHGHVLLGPYLALDTAEGMSQEVLDRPKAEA